MFESVDGRTHAGSSPILSGELINTHLLSVLQNYFSYFSTKTYVMGTQKNHLNEMVLLSTENMFKLMD